MNYLSLETYLLMINHVYYLPLSQYIFYDVVSTVLVGVCYREVTLALGIKVIYPEKRLSSCFIIPLLPKCKGCNCYVSVQFVLSDWLQRRNWFTKASNVHYFGRKQTVAGGRGSLHFLDLWYYCRQLTMRPNRRMCTWIMPRGSHTHTHTNVIMIL